MASSLISSSSHHIDFDSVFGIDDAGMVQMFESLIATGLKEFLGCPAVFSEAALTKFFANSSVRDGVVVSTIKGKAVEISEEVFATTFELPTEGLTDISEVPKNLVFDARSLFSVSQEQVSISCFKKEMNIQYHLLSDILAKNIYVKAESFDVVTHDRFLLMPAITFDVKVNWSRLLFDVLKDMVTSGSRQAKGYAIQICVLLKNIPGLELGESRAFPLPRVLNEKTVHRYVTINEKVGAEEVTDAPRVKKTPAKKAVSQKQPVVDAAVAPVVKKKRTTKGKPVAMETVAVAQEAVSLQIFEATADAPVEQSPVPKRKIHKRKRRLVMETDDEINVEKQPAIENLDEQVGGPADDSIDKGTVVGNVASIDDPESSEKEPVDEPVAGQPEVVPVAEATNDDPDAIIEHVLDQLDSLATTDGGDQPAATEMETGRTVGTDAAGNFVEEPDEEMAPVVEDLSADEAMSLEDILMTIPVEVPLPSTGLEFTKITLGKEIKIPGVTARTWFLASLPQIPVDNKGKEILVKKDPVKGLRDTLRQQDEYFRRLIQSAQLDGKNHSDLHLLHLNEFKKSLLAHNVTIIADFMDVKKAVRDLNAKVDAVSTRLDDVKQDIEATKEAISHQLLDFQAQAQANHNIFTDQLSELVNYINRGGNDKKGEGGSSRGPQPPPDD
ncbi:hypothetical protein F511_23500 [Dorcoceras hygrometricum]|uniref:Dystroglycan-like n=1 Tax=Dorcoceras hygrometricum TaxID=472368 RepID=A0A2Z7A7C8_9LAMI|nr:hypothetical protein F511_23500 [Dorcoceras hygrometricum]